MYSLLRDHKVLATVHASATMFLRIGVNSFETLITNSCALFFLFILKVFVYNFFRLSLFFPFVYFCTIIFFVE